MPTPPETRTIETPEGGWKERTLYLVECALTPTNLIHRGIFYTGFLTRGEPAGYHNLMSITGCTRWSSEHECDRWILADVHYLKIISEIGPAETTERNQILPEL